MATTVRYDAKALAEFSEASQLLLEPFPEEDISYIDGFAYDDPERYRYRLLKVFKGGFSWHMEDCHETSFGDAKGLAGYGHFVGKVDGELFDRRVFAFEKFQLGADDSPNAGKTQKEEYTAANLDSALLKQVSRDMGLGLHLYVKDAKKSSKKGGSTNTPDTNASTGPWDGSYKWSFGKFAGSTYADPIYKATYEKPTTEEYVKYLDWASTKERPDTGSIKEYARRKQLGQVAVKPTGSDQLSDEIPFS